MSEITTTLKKIRKHRPCGLEIGSNECYDKLRKTLGKIYGDDTPIRFSKILEINGLDDALWCLFSICPEHEREVRLFAADCAEHEREVRLFAADCTERALHIYEEQYPNDTRVRGCINTSRKFANGEATQEELAAARDASRSAEKEYQVKLLIERFG